MSVWAKSNGYGIGITKGLKLTDIYLTPPSAVLQAAIKRCLRLTEVESGHKPYTGHMDQPVPGKGQFYCDLANKIAAKIEIAKTDLLRNQEMLEFFKAAGPTTAGPYGEPSYDGLCALEDGTDRAIDDIPDQLSTWSPETEAGQEVKQALLSSYGDYKQKKGNRMSFGEYQSYKVKRFQNLVDYAQNELRALEQMQAGLDSWYRDLEKDLCGLGIVLD